MIEKPQPEPQPENNPWSHKLMKPWVRFSHEMQALKKR